MRGNDRLGAPRSSNERLHRAWERRHPYNFVCIVDVTTGVRADELRRAAMETLAEFDLCMHVNAKGAIQVVVTADLEQHALRELNARVDGAVRLAIQCGASMDAPCRVAITYRHLFVDGTNSTVFLRRTLMRAVGQAPPSIELGPFRRGRDWLLANGVWKLPGLLGRLALDTVKMRSVYARGDGTESPEVEGRFVDYSPALLNRLRREGDRVGATVNDVLLARMARAALRIEASGAGRDRNIAVSMAVSLRNGIEPLHPGVCVAVSPIYVGSTTDILRSIQRQTTGIKRTRSYMRSLIGMGIGARLWRTPEVGCRSSNAYVPSLALTNMRVPASAGDELVLRWRRVVGAGPMAPLLVTALTHAERLELSLSWRKGLFSDRELSLMVSSLCE